MNNYQNRRQFLQTLALGAGAFSVPVWANDKTGLVSGLPKSMRSAGGDFSNYGKPSEYEKKPFAGFLLIAPRPVMGYRGRHCTSCLARLPQMDCILNVIIMGWHKSTQINIVW